MGHEIPMRRHGPNIPRPQTKQILVLDRRRPVIRPPGITLRRARRPHRTHLRNGGRLPLGVKVRGRGLVLLVLLGVGGRGGGRVAAVAHGDALEAREAGDALRALGLEGVRGVRGHVVRGQVASVAIFYGGCGEGGEGGCRAGWGAAGGVLLVWLRSRAGEEGGKRLWAMDREGGTHGMSGVSGVGDGGGRLMRMGCWPCACCGWLLGCV